MDRLRRVEVIDDAQLGATIFYIHKNPVHHGYTNEISEWRWSSYKAILSSGDTHLLRNEILEWFGGVEQFIEFHKQPVYLKNAIVLE